MSRKAPSKGQAPSEPKKKSSLVSAKIENWQVLGAWVIALGALFFAGYLGVQALSQPGGPLAPPPVQEQPENDEPGATALSELTEPESSGGISGQRSIQTEAPERDRKEALRYEVVHGDTLESIGQYFGLKPETILWANEEVLFDNPDFLAAGMELLIPPTDGIYHRWEATDLLDQVLSQYGASEADLLAWHDQSEASLLADLDVGDLLIIPGGRRESNKWNLPSFIREFAESDKEEFGNGACEENYEGLAGSGEFAWPTLDHELSGHDYWPEHQGIDIHASDDAEIRASDDGVVTFAGWFNGGDGRVVLIDHGNGYHSLYAHLKLVETHCGASVAKGEVIGIAGSFGSAFGPHLHFEIRRGDEPLNPWSLLPAE